MNSKVGISPSKFSIEQETLTIFLVPNGQYYPGLMYVDTPLKGWYAGSEQNPSEGKLSETIRL